MISNQWLIESFEVKKRVQRTGNNNENLDFGEVVYFSLIQVIYHKGVELLASFFERGFGLGYYLVVVV